METTYYIGLAQQPMCSAALKINRSAVSGFELTARSPATGRTSSVFP